MSSSCINFPASSSVLKTAPRFSLHTLSPRSWAVSFGKYIVPYFEETNSCTCDATLARTSIPAVLDSAITIGHLTISDSEGTHYYGKYQKGCNDVHLNVMNDTFWLRILMSVASQFSNHKLS